MNTTVEEAGTNLVAEERRRVGLATVADVLQARTAASQAQLNLQTIEGNVQTTRGALALFGLPANLPFDVDTTVAIAEVAPLADSVNAIIATALQGRPDLAASRAEVEAAHAGITEARGALLPSLGFSATGGRTYATTIPDGASSYTLSLGLSIPIFSGFSRQHDPRRGAWRRRRGRTDAQQKWSFQVFSAYYALQTATRRSAPPRTCSPVPRRPTKSRSRATRRCRLGARPPRAERPRERRSGWRRGSPGASRSPNWPTTPASSTPASRTRSGSPTTRRRSPNDESLLRSRPGRFLPDSPPARRRRCRRHRRSRSLLAVVERQAVPFEPWRPGRWSLQAVSVQPQVSGPIVRVAFREGQDVEKGSGALPDRSPAPPGGPVPGRGDPRARQGAGGERPPGGPLQRAGRSGVRHRAAVRPVAYRRGGGRRHARGEPGGAREARLNLQYATIRAPIAGRTGSLRVREGNLVRANEATPLVTINQIRPILVRFAVPAANLVADPGAAGEKLVVRAEPVGGGPARARCRSWTTRTPPPAPSC